MNEVINDLQKCKVEGNTVYLPTEPLSNYPALKKALISYGAKYSRNKFIFPDRADIYVEGILNGVTDFKKSRQFFETPDDVAENMVMQGFVYRPEDGVRILEPSAGHGQIIKAILKEAGNRMVHVTAIEKDDFNFKVLEKKNYGINLAKDDFLNHRPKEKYDYIFMNPPFTGGQDVAHITYAIGMLKDGGTLMAIASGSITFNTQKKFKEFRELLDELEGETFPMDSGTFKSSGTMVSSVMIKIQK